MTTLFISFLFLSLPSSFQESLFPFSTGSLPFPQPDSSCCWKRRYCFLFHRDIITSEIQTSLGHHVVTAIRDNNTL